MRFPLKPAVILLVLLAAAQVASAAVPAWLAPITQTAEPFLGVTHYQITQSLDSPTPYILPRELSIHIVEIDPSAPGVSFLGTPGNGAVAEEYTRQTTSAFVNGNDLALAINGDFYSTDTGLNASVSGLGMSNGVVVSPGVSGRPSFIVREDNTAVVRTNGSVPANSREAVSGNQRLIQNGVNVTPIDSYTTTLNPHTAIGVDDSNGHIFFMTVDGRQTDFSDGMRTDEMADILIGFGVDQAINLDGGGSTTLAFADGPGGAARTVNSPSDGASSQQPGGERLVANHLGVFATANPSYVPLPAPPRPGAPPPDPLLASLTIIDGFDGDEGRFTWAPFASSGSTNGITQESTAEYTDAHAHSGAGSQQITLVRDQSPTARLRHVSGGGNPLNNRIPIGGDDYALAPQGFVGFFLKTTEVDLQVGIGLDDGVAGGSTGLELGASLPVIADGQWHLYEWNLDDADQWTNFSGGNGAIGGPNAYVDSVFIYAGASTTGDTLTMFLDAVAYNPHGSLASLSPPSYAADFDGDNDVDDDDLAIYWTANFGSGPAADADGDDDSDGADFLIWQQEFGAGVESPLVRAVPEPAGFALSGVLLLCRAGAGRRRRC